MRAQLLELVAEKQIVLQLTVPPAARNESSNAPLLVPSSPGERERSHIEGKLTAGSTSPTLTPTGIVR